jgi:predicted MFS family arabinose efflux permease
MGSGWGLGFMTALLVMPLVQQAGGFRLVFGVTAGFALLVGFAMLLQARLRARFERPSDAGAARRLLKASIAVMANLRVDLLAVFNCVGLAISVGAVVWTPGFLQSHYSISGSVSAYMTAGLGAAQVVGVPVGAAVARRWGQLFVIGGCIAMMTLLIVLIPLVPGVGAVIFVVTALGFFSMAYFSPLLALVPQVVQRLEEIGPATGITALGFIGSLLAPWLFGMLLDSGRGYLSAYLMLTAFGVVGLASTALFGLLTRGRRSGKPLTRAAR